MKFSLNKNYNNYMFINKKNSFILLLYYNYIILYDINILLYNLDILLY